MEGLLITLFALSILLHLCRVSLFQNFWLIIAYSFLPTLAPVLLHEWLTEQDNQYINQVLQDRIFMNDLALLVVVEALIVLSAIFTLSRKHFKEKVKPHLRLLQFFPNILPAIALVYFEFLLFYQVLEYDYLTIAYSFSIGAILVSVLIIALIKKVIDEWEIRLELSFMLAFIQCIIAVIIGSYYNSIQSQSIVGNNSWKPLIVVLIGGIVFSLLGFIITRIKIKRKQQKWNL